SKWKAAENAASDNSIHSEETAGETMSTRTIRNLFAPGVVLTLLLAAASLNAASKKKPPKPTVDECLACHSDATLTHEVNGKTVNLHVDPQAFKDSIH